ncbi:MAG: YjjG family noncanonical pyrimidine nucleotidase [Bacteroidales bacterium]|jgi:putative hydrolase of the HAD superfamily
MKYKHLFFDLDRTIWDFESNSNENFNYIFEKYELKKKGIPSVKIFQEKYQTYNAMLWDFYKKGQIPKEVLKTKRFELTLLDFGIDNYLMAVDIGNDYVENLTNKTYVFPNTFEVLNYLHKKYELHIITNGFDEVQFKKIISSNLNKYFKNIITSEEAGVKKPDPKIFLTALEKANAKVEESLMIGDDMEVDIIGARTMGIDQVLFNPNEIKHNETITYEIKNLKELMVIL